MSKNRFYMYTEYIHFLEGMTIEDQALLFRVILQHEGGLKVEEMTPAVKAVFSMIKNRLDKERILSDEERAIRNSSEYKRFRNAVLKRDRGVCQSCGTINKIMHVHHILSFRDFPKLRTNVSNGITLCEKCHREVHNGKR